GVSPAVRSEAKLRGLEVIDATCPLVTKVHLEAIKFARLGYTVVLIGHRQHDEVIGTLGEAPDATVLVETVQDVENLKVPNPDKVAYLTQTTLSLDETREIVEALRRKFPGVRNPPAQDICYATENRQMGVKAVAPLTDVLLVVGSNNSSNSMRLVEVCQQANIPAYLIDDYHQINPDWLRTASTLAVTAGASAPENLVQELIQALKTQHGFGEVEELTLKEEDVRFSLPSELASAAPRLHTIANL
ncbi:MAG TPA: 4-hydroxy-3-methylbut-2-enyl diphosphate reductase, partial [Bryobacteraceae bacterium]|nr:4-hydroxy-3-methylbut-2-enyl diphosphate reductase [Bryobacteraceae bacterium]